MTSVEFTSVAKLTLAISALFALGLGQSTTSQLGGTTTSFSGSPQSTITQPSTTETANMASGASNTPHVHLVKVGAGGFYFEPNTLSNVSIGDTVTFEFYPPDHSVARAEYGSACMPYEYTGRGKIGFWSGTQIVKTAGDLTHWNLTINSTEPIFYYCTAPNSCTGEQMVGAINPNSTQTLDAQIRAAAKADFMVAPGDPVPKETSSSSVSQHSPGLSTAAIIGIVFGGLAFMALCAGCFFCMARKARVRPKDTSYTPASNAVVVSPVSPEPYGYASPFSPCMSIPPYSYEAPSHERAVIPPGQLVSQAAELEAGKE